MATEERRMWREGRREAGNTEWGVKCWFCFMMRQKGLSRGSVVASTHWGPLEGKAGSSSSAWERETGGISVWLLCLLFLIHQNPLTLWGVSSPHSWVSSSVPSRSCFRCQERNSAVVLAKARRCKEEQNSRVVEEARVEGPKPRSGPGWSSMEGICRDPPACVSYSLPVAPPIHTYPPLTPSPCLDYSPQSFIFCSAFLSHTTSPVNVKASVFP